MPEPDFNLPRAELSGMPSPAAPPVIPPPIPVGRTRRLPSWAIVALCAAGVVMLLAIGLLTLGLVTEAVFKAKGVAPARSAAEARPARPGPTMGSGAREVRSSTGVTYTNVIVARVPWSIHILKVERARKDLAFYSAHARGKVLGVSLLGDQARAVPRETGRALAGVNGDFYLRDDPMYAGDPRGLQIVNGELISAPDTFSVWFDPDGHPQLDEVKADFNITWPDGRKTRFSLNEQRRRRMTVLYTPTYDASTRVRGGRDLVLEKEGESPWLPLQAGQTYRARVREVRLEGNTRLAADTMVLSLAPDLLATLPEVAPGAVLQISTATTPDLKGVKSAIGGGPALIQGGKTFSQRRPSPGAWSDWSERSKYERHPRSAVGWSPTHVYLVTVDGRQPGLSEGMRLAELAEFMASLGCTEAMNLDGGKSAQMWLNGRIMNSPCQGEDTVANSLLVIQKSEGHL